MGSKYAFQKIEIVKRKLRLRKSSRLLQRIALLVSSCFGKMLPTGESARNLSSGEINYLQKNFKMLKNVVVEYNEKKSNTIVITHW